MSMNATLAALGAALALAVLFGWIGARPPNLMRGPRMIPWRWLMLFSVAACLLFIIHIFALLQGQGG